MTDKKDDCPHCGEDISDVTHGLKNALEVTRDEKKEIQRKYKALEDGAVSKEEYDARSTELDAAKEQLAASVSKSDFDNLTTDLEESRATTTKLQDEATTGKIATAVAKAGGNQAMLDPMIKAKLVANPKLDIDELVAGLKNDEDFAGAFKASGQSGGGSPPGKGGDVSNFNASKNVNLRRSEMSDKQKNEYQKTHGLDALLDLPL